MDAASVLLLSGGIDSVTLLHRLVADGEPVQGLFLDYGQRGATQERAAAAAHCEQLGVELVPLDLAEVGRMFRRGHERKAHVPLPHRNLVALSLGLSYAANLGSRRLCLAVNREDTADYASASHAFLAQFRLICGLLGETRLATPFVDLAKADVIGLGARLGVDYATTYSCLLGYAAHCGRCPQCRKRREAFAAAGLIEPAGTYRA
ncbi:MAG: 7-cyano-7-deazaguanine synthase [Burkholderiales bacterium]|nr:7-cyano-7-deazaguanine synthase [Burkholderiales bacterium]